ncbi:MAG: universal stress protein [SAR202 cluster bacterium]|nr:universal stress protein [SAR202 cluster bacterium]
MFKKILVPFDGFGLADAVLPFIPQLAKGFGSSVIMLWVMTPNGARSAGAMAVVELEEAARRLSLEVGDVSPMVTVGSPAPTIIRIAAEEGCDLIAMTTHGRGVIGRGLLGSVADEVVRYSPVPTMVFAPRKADEEWSGSSIIDRIIVPLDGSDYAESVLPYVQNMAHRMDLEIVLFRVNDYAGIYSGAWVGLPYIPVAEQLVDPAVETSDEEYLETVAEKLRSNGLRVRWELLNGNPAYQVAEFARETKHNMVALATRGHSGIERWIEGSVSERAVLDSGDPVLIIPPAAEESAVA